ncbi:copper chaperone PCu(A)C [Duganella violaceipulchra]|uniref:Copper chaperone PCu(A)C n=1 Tax=Duganella violaceipulchra TaxID=2849652 RepID=A0AA41HF30_9BURK|nr:copper chaperone PCu(A)C [Duganella violaceicalia]MBV6323359.1 copper chaperone PCu(A)C [Duganella violaceicalia]MCP2007687.1 copper(I)-binding protein [Duganella violaceicalia]
MKRMIYLMLLAALPAFAQVTVNEAWVRGTVASQKATGAFMTLTSVKDSRLVGASSPAAGVVEVHEMKMVNDMMSMRQIDGLALPAGQVVKLAPGGYHLMLMQLTQPLADGAKVPLTLEFEDANKVRSKVAVDAVVKALNSAHQH